jgi:hypothetical protein
VQAVRPGGGFFLPISKNEQKNCLVGHNEGERRDVETTLLQVDRTLLIRPSLLITSAIVFRNSTLAVGMLYAQRANKEKTISSLTRISNGRM